MGKVVEWGWLLEVVSGFDCVCVLELGFRVIEVNIMKALLSFLMGNHQTIKFNFKVFISIK